MKKIILTVLVPLVSSVYAIDIAAGTEIGSNSNDRAKPVCEEACKKEGLLWNGNWSSGTIPESWSDNTCHCHFKQWNGKYRDRDFVLGPGTQNLDSSCRGECQGKSDHGLEEFTFSYKKGDWRKNPSLGPQTVCGCN